MTYTPEKFNELVAEFLEKEEKILGWKRGEYAAGEDRLENFRTVGEFVKQRPAEVALCYLMKHIQSIGVAVETGNFKWIWHDKEGNEGMKQRLADARNYLLLLGACLEQEREND